ncbi:MAG: GNAT family N-acetyltransferase [Candidatus Marinimicrobia bacterium]|nr:GNAT family N-acetyltransferase [Candidatus Neomarinimicrobiota bacterium]
MIIIRNANKDDTATIVKFNSAMAMETESKQLDSATVRKGVEKILINSVHDFYLIAESDGVPVGQLMITKEWSDWRNGEFWWIQSVYIHPDFRKNNIYKNLYNKAINLAKESDKVCGIRLYVDKDNISAQNVYSKLGMKESNYVFFEEDWSDV